MNANAGRVRVGGGASVGPGIRLHGLLDQQATGGRGALLRDQADAAARRVEVYDLGVVRPQYGGHRFRGVLHQTRQVDRRSHVYEQIWAAYNFSDWF